MAEQRSGKRRPQDSVTFSTNKQRRIDRSHSLLLSPPPPIDGLIFSFVDIEDLARVQEVCTQWKYWVNSYNFRESRWGEFCMDVVQQTKWHEKLDWVLKTYPGLTARLKFDGERGKFDAYYSLEEQSITVDSDFSSGPDVLYNDISRFSAWRPVLRAFGRHLVKIDMCGSGTVCGCRMIAHESPCVRELVPVLGHPTLEKLRIMWCRGFYPA